MQFTAEQIAIINHPKGKHAQVNAVAGSAKTTTLAFRIKRLVTDEHVNPGSIVVLMFNSRARKQFNKKLEEIGVPENLRPQVHTFHSYSYKVFNAAVKAGLIISPGNLWIDDKEECVRSCVHRAIDNLEKAMLIPPNSVDPDEALAAIGIYKGSLIPPTVDRAGYFGNVYVPLVYNEFEKLRIQACALTYDDFVPLAVGILEAESDFRQSVCGPVVHLLVDEYQDINYGMQRLIELVAGDRADIMAVGDDDQCIYDWRGARVEYILRGFKEKFSNKDIVDYTLTNSFRLPPVIAQCASNVIRHNRQRVVKNPAAYHVDNPSFIRVINTTSEQNTDVNKELARQVVVCIRGCGDPRKVIVLGRSFSQLSGLESELLTQGIPYRVIGRAPFIERREIVALMDYIRTAAVLDSPVDKKTIGMFLSIANIPNRRLNREMLEHQLGKSGLTLRRTLLNLCEGADTPLASTQRESLYDLMQTIIRVHERITTEPDLPAGELLEWLVDAINYKAHFENYYGKGEHSDDRKRCVDEFCSLAEKTGLVTPKFIKWVEGLDSTLGKPQEQCVVLTTVYRVKGLEYDYVFIPDCIEGYMPMLQVSRSGVYDKAGIVTDPEPSEILEVERRLFYVAITRARKGVFIGTVLPPRLGSQANSTSPRPSRFIEEMKLGPTTEVIELIQGVRNQNDTAKDALIEMIRLNLRDTEVVVSAVWNYLDRPESAAVFAEILPMLEGIKEEDTSGQYAVLEPDDNGTEPVVIAEAAPDPWWEEV